MKTSAAGRAFIERWEGLYLKTYNDGGGVPTIGYGHTTAAGAPAVNYGMTITKQQADEILARDLGKVEKEVSNLVKVPLTQNQFDVLVSFHFNTGALAKSTLLRLLNSGKYQSVPAELMKWVHDNGRLVQGLINRRKAEGEVWARSDVVPADIPPPPDIPRPDHFPPKDTPADHQGANLIAQIIAFILSLFRKR